MWGKPGGAAVRAAGPHPAARALAGPAGGGTIDALTTNVDLHATLCDVFGVQPAHRTHGVSLVPLLTGEATAVRDWAIGGV